MARTASDLARLMSSTSSRVAETAKIKISGSHVVQGLFTEIALNPYALLLSEPANTCKIAMRRK